LNSGGNQHNYEQFKLGPETFSLGDTVLLKNPDADGLPFVARIMRLYQVKGSNTCDGMAALIGPEPKSAGMFVEVQWFYRAHDTVLPKAKQDECEVFESDMKDTNELSAVDSKCVVHPYSYRSSDNPLDFPDLSLRYRELDDQFMSLPLLSGV
jgi:hypothetical protein